MGRSRIHNSEFRNQETECVRLSLVQDCDLEEQTQSSGYRCCLFPFGSAQGRLCEFVVNLKKQSQFVCGRMDVNSFAKEDYGDGP
jgi:hypothetical protein